MGIGAGKDICAKESTVFFKRYVLTIMTDVVFRNAEIDKENSIDICFANTYVSKFDISMNYPCSVYPLYIMDELDRHVQSCS